MHLPDSSLLPVNKLAACFNNTVATYKFYWLFSILKSCENGDRKIRKKELFSRMISNAWYTVNYFHVSFGKQDLIQDAVQRLKTIEGIKVDEKSELIAEKLLSSSNRLTEQVLRHFD